MPGARPDTSDGEYLGAAGRALARALDPVLFAADCGLTAPDPWQRELLRSDARRMLLNIHRQGGKSTIAGILGLHAALFEAPCLVLILAPALRQSAELIRTVKEMHGRLDGVPELAMESVTRLELSNASRLIALPGSESTVRGYSAPRMVIIDEAARVTDDLIGAAMPMLATVPSGRVIGLSTPARRRGWFFEQWTGGGDRWQRVALRADENPRIDPGFLEEQRKELGELRYRQEYLNEFVDDGASAFSSILIAQAFTREVPYVRIFS